MKRKNRAELGTLSHGTLRNEDLIPVLAEELARLAGPRSKHYGMLIRDARKMEDFDSELADCTVQELMEALEEFAPTFAYFGAHEGDGSDIGFWPAWPQIEEARHEGWLASGDQLPERSKACEFLVVNDHGNATLYTRAATNQRWREAWSCV